MCREHSILMIFFIIFLCLCVDLPRLCLHPLAPSEPPNILPSLSQIDPPPRKGFYPMCDHLKAIKLMFETKLSVSFKPRTHHLLPMKIEKPKNLKFDNMKN